VSRGGYAGPVARLPLAALLLLLLAPVADAEPRFVPDVLLVKLRAADPTARAAALERVQREVAAREPRALFRRAQPGRARAAASRDARRPELAAIYRLRLAEGIDPAQAAAALAGDPDVEWAQPDLLLQPDFVPDDPFFLSSGSWGQPYADLWGLYAVRAPEAWAYTRGEGAVIAIVDSGLDDAHPDAADNVWVNPGEDLDGDGRATDADRNGIDDDGNGFVDDLIGFDFHNSLDANGDGDYLDPGDVSDADPFDDGGHGTHVAGTAAAVGGNGIGVLGVAPRAKLMALKGFPATGSATSSALARAVVYAADNGADVVNASWSCGERCPVNPLIDEAVLYAHALGTVFVDSAGNSGDDVVFYSPEKRRETIVVAATNEDDSHADFSSVGFLVDVAAPGAGRARPGDPFASRAILSMLSSGAPEGFSARLRVGDAWLRLSGTSMATPHVAGVVALVRSLHPDATPEEIRALLRATARDVGTPGHDRLFGAGIVDALAAVTGRAPRVHGVFGEPMPGAILDARAGALALRGSADGADFASYALAFGRGVDPAVWEPIEPASSGPVQDDLLASWRVDALDVGSYVLRLEVTSRSGEGVREFLPVSLERNPPIAVSPLGPAAFAPDLSGDVAVWEQQSGLPDGGRDVFAKDLRRGGEIAVAEQPGDQRFPRASGRRIAFLDREHFPGGEIATCTLAARGSCDVVHVATGRERRSGPVPSGDRLFWVEDAGSGASARMCELRRNTQGCTPVPVTDRPARPFDLDVSGLRLVWRELTPSPSVWTCLLDPASGACPARRVYGGAPFPFAPTLSGRLFAWERFSSFPGIGTGSEVQACRLDPATGACPAQSIGAPTPSAPGPDVAGDVIVWSAATGDEATAIFFCEHDPITGSCPVQRLTGAAAGQQNPAISERRVLFEDSRDGPSRIYGVELPDLVVHGARRVREGGFLHVLVAGHDPERAPMALAAELVSGAPVESISMRFQQLGRSIGLLSWRPRRGDAGSYTVQIRGTTTGQLVTRETLVIEVEAVRHGGGRR